MSSPLLSQDGQHTSRSPRAQDIQEEILEGLCLLGGGQGPEGPGKTEGDPEDRSEGGKALGSVVATSLGSVHGLHSGPRLLTDQLWPAHVTNGDGSACTQVGLVWGINDV